MVLTSCPKISVTNYQPMLHKLLEHHRPQAPTFRGKPSDMFTAIPNVYYNCSINPISMNETTYIFTEVLECTVCTI